MWSEVFLMSQLKVAGCRKVMPSGAPAPQELMEVFESLTDLNSLCHSTGRNWSKPFPYVFPISLGLAAPSLLQMLPKAILRQMCRRYCRSCILPLSKSKREGNACTFSTYFISVGCLKSIFYHRQAAGIIRCCTNQTAKR